MNSATEIYRAIMVEIERRRMQLGWPMWKVDEAAGTNDGHYSHCVYPDQTNGRQAQWSTLTLFIEAMFPDGFDVSIKPAQGVLTPDKQRNKIRSAAAMTNAKVLREVMAELGRMGGIASASVAKRKPKKWKRQAIARKAAKTRWERARNARLMGVQKAETKNASGAV